MNRILVAAAVSMLAGTAFAADLAPAPAEPAAPAYVPYNWTGFYAGINGGYAFSAGHHVNMTELFDGAGPFPDTYGSVSPKGVFGGLQGGYNWQYGNFVLGLEGDVQGAGITDTASAVGPISDYFVKTKSQVSWFGTVRPRVGYAFDNILVYATGGLAFGGVKLSQNYNDDPYFATIRDDKTKAGYALGAGVEYAFSEHWTAKLEYQYIDLGSSTMSGTEILDAAPTGYTIHTKLRSDFHTVRLGVNYKF
ncbi:porin [Labrys miyagiensis]